MALTPGDVNLTALIARKEFLFQELTRINGLVSKVGFRDVLEAEAQLAALSRHENSFSELVREILTANSLVKPSEGITTRDFETFQTLIDAIRKHCLRCKSQTIAQGASQPSSNLDSVRLPRINLPTFDGDIGKWNTFLEQYNALIHCKPISNVEKLSYLKSVLVQEALSIVNQYELSEASYELAYNALLQRYNNPRLLATHHINKILNYTNTAPASRQFTKFLETHRATTSSIKSLAMPDLGDFLLFELCYRNLPLSQQKAFDRERNNAALPTLEQLLNFVENLARIEELHANEAVGPTKDNSRRRDPKILIGVKREGTRMCPNCSQDHALFRCKNFAALPMRKKLTIVQDHGLCRRCLGNHRNACQSAYSCRHCQSENHHTFLCDDRGNNPNSSQKPETGEEVVQPQGTCNACVTKASPVLLGTIEAKITDVWGNPHQVRVVCDSGSQANLITHSLMKRLGLKRTSATLEVRGVSGNNTKVLGSTTLKLQAKQDPSISYECGAFILPTICGPLPGRTTAANLPEPLRHLPLADPEFQISKEVDVLLGVEAYTDILSTQEPTTIKGNPTAVRTIFGYILVGRAEPSCMNRAVSLCTTTLDKALRDFWEVEDDSYSGYMRQIHCSITVRTGAPPLASNLKAGLRSFLRLEDRLKHNPLLARTYADVIQDYLDQGHMSVVDQREDYVLPHHCVFKDSTSTAVRVVFDASFPDESGTSLNSRLLSGGKLQNELPQILLSFRFHEVALQADIKQMFRNIQLHPDDRKYQRILWRFSPEEELNQYSLNTVTFGVTSSPFLAQRVLQQLVEDEGSCYPEASKIILHHSFVDDFVTGAPSVTAARKLQREMTVLLEKGGFQLRKWACSHPGVLDDLPSDYLETPFAFPTGEKGVKVLGILWDQTSDALRYHVERYEDASVTKRSVASYVAKIWDCLGLLAPVVLKGKHFLQRLWLDKRNWDEPLPLELCEPWRKFTDEMHLISELRIPRRLPTRQAQLRLVGFSDASEIAMAAAVYLHSTLEDGRCELRLLMAKTKLAPLKTWTIPRLELSAAVLLAKVVNCVRRDDLKEVPIHLFTDSQIVLAWLKIPPHNLKIFVANRVIQILEMVPNASWNFVPGNQNPADLGSRGLNPSQILDNPLWWTGPTFLIQPVGKWTQLIGAFPNDGELGSLDDFPEVKKPVSTLVLNINPDERRLNDMINKFSSLLKIQRVMAFILRFINNCRRKEKIKENFLTAKELQLALETCVRLTQELYFQGKAESWEKGSRFPKTLQKLNPFVDSSGLLRAGGRIRRATYLPEDARHPWILPKECNLPKAICDYFHAKLLHAGPRTTQTAILQRFWIISLRQLLKKRIRLCLKCYKLSANPNQPVMGDLPYARVNIARPFTDVATDFGGPFNTKESRIRRSVTHKSYLCVFVCLSTKAVHIESVTDLTSKAFLAAFVRFSARRGMPLHVYSDCGRNFVGAARELQECSRARDLELTVKEFAAERGISWHFAPPYGPNFNGLAEGAIKSAKYHLLRQIGNEVLTLEEFTTLLCRVEAVLNSRPLTALGTDPNEELYLSPAHFLIGDRMLNPPEAAVVATSLRNRWEGLQQKSQAFWKQWSREYLHTMLQRQRWTKPSSNLKVGQVVFISSETLPPLQWPIGRITSVRPGEDGIVRVVTIRCAKGEITRPVNKLLVLPEESSIQL